jgi:hypothetical protein
MWCTALLADTASLTLCPNMKASSLVLFTDRAYVKLPPKQIRISLPSNDSCLLTTPHKTTSPIKMKFLILVVVMMALFSSVALTANKKNAGSKYSKNKKGKPHQGA